MSGEYYCTDDSSNAFYKGYENALNPTGDLASKNQGHRLQDIEEQLEMAESRCNSLKDQLDHMKQMYGLKKQGKIRKISNLTSLKRISDENVTITSVSASSMDGKSINFQRIQSSNAIGTDTTGAAVRTINNILNGITNSVNRLSELHVQITETPKSRHEQTSPKGNVIQVKVEKTRSNEKDLTQRNTIQTLESLTAQVQHTESGNKVSAKSRNIRKKSKDPKTANRKPVTQNTRRSTKTERRSRASSTYRTSLDHPSMPASRTRLLKTIPKRSDNLVEIYHNIAAKQSDSDEGNLNRNKASQITVAKKPSTEIQLIPDDIPPLNINNKADNYVNTISKTGSLVASASKNIQTYYEPPEAPRTVSSFTKNYELPTIASRMKQAAKYYLHSFNFKAIPFCPASSTSPSHNIGINIQQVMNIIKNRQPINGISPTLAHNIGLAAERLNSQPLTALVSTINSRTCYRPSNCPLSKTYLNYQQLQDMAKSIPEETPEDMEEIDSPKIKTVLITGPSGDMEIKNKNVPIWAMDPSKSEQCTCVPRNGVDFQQIVRKYKRSEMPTTSQHTITTEIDKRWASKRTSKKIITKKPLVADQNGYVSLPIQQSDQSVATDTPLTGKEKNLKDVLMNLHNEFESLNQRYEDLCQNSSPDDQNCVKELEELERELSKKEEEITMVMTLYKEVLALKQQIKLLKQKQSQSSIAAQEKKDILNYSDYNNPRAALHLTKLLKQIQLYQWKYRKNSIET